MHTKQWVSLIQQACYITILLYNGIVMATGFR